MQADLATRLCARLAQGREVHQPLVDRLGMSAGLQPAAQFGVMQERDLARIDIDHQCACGEVRLGLVPRERLREAWQKPAHLGEAAGFVGIRWTMGVEQGLQGGWQHFRRDFSGDAWRTLLSARVGRITVIGTTIGVAREAVWRRTS